MALAVVTVAAGGLPVVNVTSVAPHRGLPVTESPNGQGLPITITGAGIPIVFVSVEAPLSAPQLEHGHPEVPPTPASLLVRMLRKLWPWRRRS